jgi:2-iminobutanoate/2-iminopropanoate deaminase
MKTIIKTDQAPQAIGPYNQAVIHLDGNLVFTAGQLGLDPQTGDFAGDTIEEQTRQALDNLSAILKAAGSDLTHVIKTTLYLKDMNDFNTVNQIYADYFKQDPPARSAVQVARLPKDGLFEIEAIARVD